MCLLVIDFEFSTKMSYGSPRAWFPEIIEVGAVLVNANGSPTEEQYSAIIKPRFWPKLNEECYGITGISQNDVENGIPLEVALNSLQLMAPSKDTWLIAWGDSDRKVLGNACEKYGISYPFVYENYIDFGFAYQTFYKLERMASLKSAIEATNVQMVGFQHSALDDAINTALVMQKLISLGWVLERVPLSDNYNYNVRKNTRRM